MRSSLRIALLTGLVVALSSARSFAVSIDDLVNLKANGLGDEILVALIETDGSVFLLSADDVVDLSARGLGERVIVAMIRTVHRPVRTDPSTEASRRAPVETPAPVVVHGTTTGVFEVHQTVVQNIVVLPLPQPVAVRPQPPVYWGFGGRLRSDAWVPAPGDRPPAVP